MKKLIVVGVFFVVIAIAILINGAKFVEEDNESRSEQGLEDMNELEKMEDTKNGQDTQEVTDKQDIKYRTVDIYYYDLQKDNCNIYKDGLVALKREVPDSDDVVDVIKSTINLWLEGEITEDETSGELSAELSADDGVKLTDASLDEGGVLILTFSDPDYKTNGGSCHVGVIAAEIDAIVKQFAEVKTLNIFPKDIFDA